MTPGEEFVRALVAKDAHGLKELLSPGVDLKALTPGRFWESDSVDEIVDETLLGSSEPKQWLFGFWRGLVVSSGSARANCVIYRPGLAAL